jgi:chromosome segregation ATPase
MLVLEGFGNIVSSPTHEKIAVILADRLKLLDELNQLKQKNGIVNTKKEFISHIDSLEDEIEMLKGANRKLSSELDQFRLMSIERQEKLKDTDSDCQTIRDADSNRLTMIDEEDTNINEVELETIRLEMNKVNEDNLNLKLEIDKLYDEIASLELQNKTLKNESKQQLKTSLKMKQEIDDLNNELDELIQVKENYAKLKVEYNELTLKLKESTQSSSTSSTSSPSQSPSLLELDWIRNENEKLLIDLEQTQIKLNNKLEENNQLNHKLSLKDGDILQKQNDLKEAQNRINELESSLIKQRDIITANEQKQRDLTELTIQLKEIEEKNKDSLCIIEHQNDKLDEMEEIIKEKNLNDKRVQSQYKRDIECRDNELTELKRLINDELNIKLKELTKTIKINEMDIEVLRGERDSLKKRAQQLENEMATLAANQKDSQDNLIKEKQVEIEKLLKQIETIDHEKVQATNKVKQLQIEVFKKHFLFLNSKQT